jgi:thiamine biosynthesis lipoprotein
LAAVGRLVSAALAALAVGSAAGAESAVLAQPTESRDHEADRKHHFQAQSMGTLVDITLWTDDGGRAQAASEAVFEEFRRLDALMSNWVDTSEVSRVNAAAGGKPVPVSDELLHVVSLAQKVSRRTGGAFDITVGAYRGLWKFDQDLDGTLPEPAEVTARRRLTGYRDLLIDARRKTIKLRRKGMAITLGGIAKGYAVDRAAAILRDRGLDDFIVQAGGDLFVSGTKGAQKWRVGIRDPRGARDATFALTELTDRTFSTAGDYERGFVKDGVRYHHILDPKTGYPTRGCRSVTVIAKDAMTADAWDTTLLVLGPERGLKLAEKLPDIEAVFVDSKNKVRVTSGLALVEGDVRTELAAGLVGRILILHPPTDAP